MCDQDDPLLGRWVALVLGLFSDQSTNPPSDAVVQNLFVGSFTTVVVSFNEALTILQMIALAKLHQKAQRPEGRS